MANIEETLADLTTLKITEAAYEKATRYAKFAFKQQKSECYGWLLTPSNGEDSVVRDVMFADRQKASYVRVETSDLGVVLSAEDAARRGYKFVGWWHSHADFEPFQSGIDKNNTMGLVNLIGLKNFRDAYEEKTLLDGEIETVLKEGGLLLKEKSGSRSVLLKGDFGLQNGLSVRKANLIVEQRLSFCYSLTVNSKRYKPSAQVAVGFENGDYTNVRLIDASVKILDDEDSLKGEVEKKLS